MLAMENYGISEEAFFHLLDENMLLNPVNTNHRYAASFDSFMNDGADNLEETSIDLIHSLVNIK